MSQSQDELVERLSTINQTLSARESTPVSAPEAPRAIPIIPPIVIPVDTPSSFPSGYKWNKNVFSALKNGGVKALESWIFRGNTLNFKDQEGNTLMHYACMIGQWELIEYFFDQGRSFAVYNTQGQDPWRFALWSNKLSIQALVDLFQKREDKINGYRIKPKLKSEVIQSIRDEFDDLIRYAERKDIPIDYEYIATKYLRKYSVKIAEGWYKAPITPENLSQKEKLSMLIYDGVVVCQETANGLKFVAPDSKKPANEADRKNDVESEVSRIMRLHYAAIFALEANLYAHALKYTQEMNSAEMTDVEIAPSSHAPQANTVNSNVVSQSSAAEPRDGKDAKESDEITQSNQSHSEEPVADNTNNSESRGRKRASSSLKSVEPKDPNQTGSQTKQVATTMDTSELNEQSNANEKTVTEPPKKRVKV